MTVNTIDYARDGDGIVTLTMDDPNNSANVMNPDFLASFHDAVERLKAEKHDVRGVVLTSAKPTFFAGGDLNDLIRVTPEDADACAATLNAFKANLRALETLGVPVVAAINGAALGGGLEIALGAHRRIAVDAKGVVVGLPEVTLGLLPGGGGVTRTVRMLGIQNALMNVLLQGQQHTAAKAKELGLVDELVGSAEDLLAAARAWITSIPEASQPWDRKDYKLPGGGPTSPALAAMLPALPATLRTQLKGAPMPAPRAIVAAAVEGAYVDFDTASQIETRYLVSLVTGQVAKNMIGTFFFGMQQVRSGASRPSLPEKFTATKVGVLGAGMMGAGIAYVTAKSGADVVLKDVSMESAQKGKAYSEKLEAKAVDKGRRTREKADELLARIHPTDDPADFDGVDLVVEAVFEDPDLKVAVFREIADTVNADAVLASNTSTLPITGLASGVDRPEDFIGLHFFSPVDKMPLVEIIRGEKTSDETLARAFDYVLQINKIPIVVNDSRGFFTSRVIMGFVAEAVAAVGEGVEPATVEQAALQAGYPAGPLVLSDDISLSLSQELRRQTEKALRAEGKPVPQHAAHAVIDRLVELGRPGRAGGGGFYDYDETGKRLRIWPGLRGEFNSGSADIPLKDLQERMMFAEALETVKCLDEGVLNSVVDANIGSILGIGFPAWTGGVVQYMNQYDGGLQGFVDRAQELAERYGERFTPPKSLVDTAARGEVYA